MFKNLLQAYALLSCLIFSIITFVVLAGSINHATFYFFPELERHTPPFELETTQNYIELRKNSEILYAELKKLPLEAIEQRRKQELATWKLEETSKIKASNLQNLIKNLPWVVLSLVLLCIHVIIYKRSKHQAPKF
jgi:hypothetical protein